MFNVYRDFKLELCKVNRDVIGLIPKENIKNINKSLKSVNKIDFNIHKLYKENQINPLWYECKEERLVLLNNKEYFVLKGNSFNTNDNIKSFTAYSLEYKLTKIDVEFEDIFLQLKGDDIENDIYSLDTLLYNDTGWKVGHIDNSVFEDENGIKVRYQSGVNGRWYDFLVGQIAEQFNSLVVFDTLNKLVNFYDVDTIGENVELYLSNNNYIKSLEKVASSENLVTRMNVVGQNEFDIIGATVTGYKYIEDFSYFYDDMSNDLFNHLKLYLEMVEYRAPIWKDLINEKNEKLKELYELQKDLYVIYAEINANKSIRESYLANEDIVNSARIAAIITELIDEQTIIEVTVRGLERDVENLNSSINEINILSKKETATDHEGDIIFTEKTLNELKEFVYCNTYSNDAFLDINDLIETSKRELSLKSKPTISYKVDLKNFLNSIVDNGHNKKFVGNVNIGDIVILKDEDINKEVFLYINEFVQYPNEEKELDIIISNQKFLDTNIKTIGDKLTDIKFTKRMLDNKLYLLNEHKYNRINLNDEQIGGNI